MLCQTSINDLTILEHRLVHVFVYSNLSSKSYWQLAKIVETCAFCSIVQFNQSMFPVCIMYVTVTSETSSYCMRILTRHN